MYLKFYATSWRFKDFNSLGGMLPCVCLIFLSYPFKFFERFLFYLPMFKYLSFMYLCFNRLWLSLLYPFLFNSISPVKFWKRIVTNFVHTRRLLSVCCKSWRYHSVLHTHKKKILHLIKFSVKPSWSRFTKYFVLTQWITLYILLVY